MKEKLILSVLVDNESGVLQRVASLFSRRNYNISSLTVSETEDPNFSRMTIETNTEPENFRQIKAQLKSLKSLKGCRAYRRNFCFVRVASRKGKGKGYSSKECSSCI